MMNNVLLVVKERSGRRIIYNPRPKNIKPISCRFAIGISLRNVGKEMKKNADKKEHTGVVYFLIMKNIITGDVAERI
jgi:hypothetical protein